MKLEEDGEDYVLAAGEPSVWVKVDGLCLYVRRNDDGVSVDIYRDGAMIDEGPVASTWAMFGESVPEEVKS